ncbi:single-stranded DNA-binding protein [Deinococcus sonorensis]|uniref:Single-stranded DNA-binding protein n=1 Tax=Deinococcus sonorensis TaxID=309891 RepID=A0ABV8Y8F1_9DEIO
MPDTNRVHLIGAVARPPVNTGNGPLLTLAGEDLLPNGRPLPWYHKVQLPIGSALPDIGEMLEVHGRLIQVKWRTPAGQPRSVVRVAAEHWTTGRADDRLIREVDSVRLRGGLNRVQLSGNLASDADLHAPAGRDALVRLQLAVAQVQPGQPEHTHYFTVKAWADRARPLQGLRRGARLGLEGPLRSERYQAATGEPRNAVLIELHRARLR